MCIRHWHRTCNPFVQILLSASVLTVNACSCACSVEQECVCGAFGFPGDDSEPSKTVLNPLLPCVKLFHSLACSKIKRVSIISIFSHLLFFDPVSLSPLPLSLIPCLSPLSSPFPFSLPSLSIMSITTLLLVYCF